MPVLSLREATEKLIQAVTSMDADDLLDFHHEVFPQERKSDLSSGDDGASDRREILDYIRRGLEIEEILDYWNVVFPITSNVYYDDEDQTIHYKEFTEAAQSSE